MANLSHLYHQKEAFIFELDDVIIPQKEYDLQVYYLFANFIEYLETFPLAKDMVNFIDKRYQEHQNHKMFETLQLTFGIDEKYRENLKLLFTNAKLPLKILMYQSALEMLQDLVINRKKIFILTGGNPVLQLNKITQIDWHGLENYLKVYFADEYQSKPSTKAFEVLAKENNLYRENIVLIGNKISDKQMAENFGITFENLIIN